MRSVFLTCAMTAPMFAFGLTAAYAQPTPAPSAAASVAAAGAGTPMSDAWFAKFAPRPVHLQNADVSACFIYQGNTICSVGGGVPSHGKNITTNLFRRKHH